MKPPLKTVISASRRTDIPAFYMPWLMKQLVKGRFETVNPYNRRVSIVEASSRRVHSIVFWSKNFGPLLDGGYAETLERLGYHLFFNFTINSENRLLEPNVPPLADRLGQLRRLGRHRDPRSIAWRFDPICFYRADGGRVQDNMGDFELIAETATRCGVRRCVTSFRDDYAKIRRRTAVLKDFDFADVSLETKIERILGMQQVLEKRGIRLSTCCEKDLAGALPAGAGIGSAECIPNRLLVELYGGRLSLKPDRGQRIGQGCGCGVSRDIGSYRQHPCYHNCLFCYANPAAPLKTQATPSTSE